jgi:hypothetical protein
VPLPRPALGARALLFGAVLSACSSKSSLAGPGGTCATADDCQAGLVCVPRKSGTSVCSNDLSSVQQTPQVPPKDASTPRPADASGDDGATGDDGAAADAPSAQDAPSDAGPADATTE